MKPLFAVLLLLIVSLSAKSQTDTIYYYSNNITYQVNNIPGNTYTWNVVYPGRIISGQGTNQIVVNWGLISTPGLIPNAITVFASNQFGCPGPSSTLDIFVPTLISNIFFPNAFTPNGDGINDSWSPIPFKIIKIKWQVFNRWGERVFECADVGRKWDGKYKGIKQDMGNSVYQCWWRGVDGKEGFQKGNLILIR